jgi:hypothetical protein
MRLYVALLAFLMFSSTVVLLNFLDDSGLGGKIGNINVCAPTCADDVALIAYKLYVALLAFLMFSSTVVRAELVSGLVIPIWVALSTTGIILLSVDFSKREGYQLQPAKNVILPVKSKIKTMATNEGFWKIDNRIMSVVDNIYSQGQQLL